MLLLTCLAFVLLGSAFVVSGESCDDRNCNIPNCRCFSTETPNNYTQKQLPQIVLLTFDDAVSALLYNNFYKKLFTLKNRNGCPIGLTFFVSHEYCDYSLVHDLWTRGHEIASHSITHKADQEYWSDQNTDMWEKEFVGMQQTLTQFARVPKEDIKGIRVPFLKVGGDAQFKMMEDNGFLWDCSIGLRTVDPGTWPFSLRYSASSLVCPVGTCPSNTYPDVWVVPMLDLFNSQGQPCAMLDTCLFSSEDDLKKLFHDNFNVQYNGNRAPFGLYTHAAWFLQNQTHFDIYLDFIKEINKHDDVYIVTVSQALEYTRNPVELSSIRTYPNWKTQCTKKPSTCGSSPNCRCEKQEPWGPSERYMKVCGSCPSSYPWVGDPLGTATPKTCK